ncbi:L-serine dehydratase [Halopolyspora algeriensis]|uniref:L-serine dehydratase n=1 Tax=Halopolyspora algeriensis TaxID=1500506 RepID=A0A368VWL4_9ACTN|nr:L-serine ammonia-lyase [Halopolyspora algeriensis]RCW46243.1 L-serine dehydratase [Halopolyspora algeriensis]TQM55646.1 L-serine dehydratase [Halopolyspora algeriensis]
MTVSVFDLFSIGIGPSSSHTVGPMRAAMLFTGKVRDAGLLPEVVCVKAELFGSLGATGHGHGSPKAVLLGLEGHRPESVDPAAVADRLDEIRATNRIRLDGTHEIDFSADRDLVMHRRRSLPVHPNGMRFSATDGAGGELLAAVYYSVGGGFVVDEEASGTDRIKPDATEVAYPFATSARLMERVAESGLPVSGVMLANECSWRDEDSVRGELIRIWQVMRECVEAGCTNIGELPGGLNVARRAAVLRNKLTEADDPMEWVTLYAMAVNEENAAGGRVVTAPTNGAAGIIPAVLHYYWHFVPGADADGVVRFLLAAGAVGALFKENASISGAEVGCQGEVGSACSMAAAGLAEVLGGTPQQVENAAEIAMEHNLGLTCDPIGGLVQIPCIERNAVAAVQAITAARMALRGDGNHYVSLDKVIATMRATGKDMKVKYKETARGGLAVNLIEC